MRVLSLARGPSPTDLPCRVVSVAEPVGAVVTDTGLAFGIEPLRPFARPVRLTCTQCSWQVAVVGLPAIGERARGHASMHEPASGPAGGGKAGWGGAARGGTGWGGAGRSRVGRGWAWMRARVRASIR